MIINMAKQLLYVEMFETKQQQKTNKKVQPP